MGGGACKLLLNSGGVIGTLTGISNVLIGPEAGSVPAELVAQGEKLICGFHEELLKYEQQLIAATQA